MNHLTGFSDSKQNVKACDQNLAFIFMALKKTVESIPENKQRCVKEC